MQGEPVPAAWTSAEADTPLPGFPVQAPPSGRGRRTFAIAIGVILVLLIAAAAGAFLALRGSPEEILQAVPQKSVFVATVNLNPGAGQKLNLFRLSAKFPALGDEQKLAAGVRDELNKSLEGSGMTANDVLPWIGSEVGFAVQVGSLQSTQEELLIATKDESASKTALAKQTGSWTNTTHDGVTVFTKQGATDSYAVANGIVVLGSDQQAVFTVLDTATGKSPNFMTNTSYTAVNATLPKDRLAAFFVDPTGLEQLLQGSPLFAAGAPVALSSSRGLGGAVTAQSDGLALDFNVLQDPSKMSADQRALASAGSHTNTLLSSVPDDSYGLLAVEQVDRSLKALSSSRSGAIGFPSIANSAFVSNMTGDVALEVRPGDRGPIPGGAILIGAKDASAMKTALDELSPIVARLIDSGSLFGAPTAPFSTYRSIGKVGQGWTTTRYKGVEIRSLPIREVGISLSYAVSGNVAVIGSSAGQVEKVIDTQGDSSSSLGASATFTSALTDLPGQQALFYVDVAKVADAVKATLPPDQRFYFDQTVEPNLEPIKIVEFGASQSPSVQKVRYFVRIG